MVAELEVMPGPAVDPPLLRVIDYRYPCPKCRTDLSFTGLVSHGSNGVMLIYQCDKGHRSGLKGNIDLVTLPHKDVN